MLKSDRILIGLCVVVHAAELWAWRFQASHNGRFFVLPLLEALRIVPPQWHALGVPVLALAGAAFASGITAAGFVAAALVLYFQLQDVFAFHDGDFLLVQILVLCALRSWADRRGAVTEARDYRLAMCALTVLFYLTAGINKLNAEFLSGAVVAAIAPAGSFILRVPHGAMFVALGTAAVEIALPLLLLSGRTRLMAVALGLGLHASILLSSWRGTTFHVYAPSMYLAFNMGPRERWLVVAGCGSLLAYCAAVILPRAFGWS